ncbi:retrovirus-related pol polyprotein from transposon TNT 1-94 [Tanacetum coccineum]
MLATASLGNHSAEVVTTACYVIMFTFNAVELKNRWNCGRENPMEKEFQLNDSSKVVPQHEENETDDSLRIPNPTHNKKKNRERRRPGWQADYVMESNVAYCLHTEEGEPSTLQEALNNPDASFWKEAMQEEIEALHKNKTWELVPLPGGQLAREWEFEMKDLGPANKILGMQIHRDRVSRKIWLSQKSYVKKILQRFNMQDCKPISTPFPTDVKLSSKMSPSSEKERMEMSRVPYASAVGVVSRYMAEPGREHWEAVKRILRYIKGTSDVALCFGDSDLIVTGYVDSDYAGDLDGSKSTTGYVFTLSGGTVSWVSKLQSVVAMSTTEAEYVAAAQASKEAVWLKMLLEELGYKQEKITLFCDNQSALYLARNPAFHSKTKHIRVQYHFVREKVEEGTVDMQKIHTDDNVADYLTKAINGDKFIWCRSSCGLAET